MQQTAGIDVVSVQFATAAFNKLSSCVIGANGCAETQQTLQESIKKDKAIAVILQLYPPAGCTVGTTQAEWCGCHAGGKGRQPRGPVQA